jgi:hypothetical protein
MPETRLLGKAARARRVSRSRSVSPGDGLAIQDSRVSFTANPISIDSPRTRTRARV